MKIDLIEAFRVQLHLIFSFLLPILFYLTWRTINSYRTKEGYKKNSYDLKKGFTEYQEPNRPQSKIFENLFYLSQTTAIFRHEQLAKYLSDLLNDYFEFKKDDLNIFQKNITNSLQLLLKSPNLWVLDQYNQMSLFAKIHRENYASEFIYNELMKILTELEQLIDEKLIED